MVSHVEGLISSTNSVSVVHGKISFFLFFALLGLKRFDLNGIMSIHRDIAAGIVIVREAGGLIFDP